MVEKFSFTAGGNKNSNGVKGVSDYNEAPLTKAEKRKQRKEQREKSRISKPFKPLNESQADMFDSLENCGQVFAVGEAGTGKTYIASRHAARRLKAARVEHIIICRPTVSAGGHSLGYLPGSLNAKLRPWLIPILDALKDDLSPAQIDRHLQTGAIQFLSFEHMRGRSLKDCIVILDEAQNCTLADLRLFLTRKGDNTQYIINGDPSQCDIPNSGLVEVLEMIETFDINADIIEFDPEDVVRSEDAKEWVRAFSQIP